MLMANDGEIENHDGTQGVNLFFLLVFCSDEAACDPCLPESVDVVR